MPGHQNGAGAAHAHDADPSGRCSRSGCSPHTPQPRERRVPHLAALLCWSCGRVAPPYRVWGLVGAASALACSAPASGVVFSSSASVRTSVVWSRLETPSQRLESKQTGSHGPTRLGALPETQPDQESTGLLCLSGFKCMETLSQNSDWPIFCRFCRYRPRKYTAVRFCCEAITVLLLRSCQLLQIIELRIVNLGSHQVLH